VESRIPLGRRKDRMDPVVSDFGLRYYLVIHGWRRMGVVTDSYSIVTSMATISTLPLHVIKCIERSKIAA